MTNEPSPRPWRVDESDASLVRDANGRFVARADSADAQLIVDAVNHIEETKRLSIKLYDPIRRAEAERDRLRDIVRRLLVLRRGDIAVPMDTEKQILAEARAAVGEGETPTGKGVGA